MVFEKNKNYVGYLIRTIEYGQEYHYFIFYQQENNFSFSKEILFQVGDLKNFEKDKFDLWFEYDRDYPNWEVISDGYRKE